MHNVKLSRMFYVDPASSHIPKSVMITVLFFCFILLDCQRTLLTHYLTNYYLILAPPWLNLSQISCRKTQNDIIHFPDILCCKTGPCSMISLCEFWMCESICTTLFTSRVPRLLGLLALSTPQETGRTGGPENNANPRHC